MIGPWMISFSHVSMKKCIKEIDLWFCTVLKLMQFYVSLDSCYSIASCLDWIMSWQTPNKTYHWQVISNLFNAQHDEYQNLRKKFSFHLILWNFIQKKVNVHIKATNSQVLSPLQQQVNQQQRNHHKPPDK